MSALLAGLPILVILVLMLGVRWSAARAGVVGVGVAVVVAAAAFPFGVGPDARLPLATALGGVAAESGFTALTILWIIGPALGIHQLQLRTGAAEVLRRALTRFAPDPRILALLVAWFFVLFMEGAAGFGSSVALAAPFLVGAGFRPVEAVTITLIGHVVGVSFGAIGTPIVPQVAATGITGAEIAQATGIFHSLLGWIPLVILVHMVARATPDSASGRGIWLWTAVAFLAFAIPYTLLWRFVGPELPTVGGALFGGVLFVTLFARFGPRPERAAGGGAGGGVHEEPGPSRDQVLRAAAPYLVLVVLVLVTRLVPGLREPLREVRVSWEFLGIFTGSIEPLYHPGSMLLAAFLAGAVLQRAELRTSVGAVVDATRRILPVAVALVAMLAISRIMVHSGMTGTLAVAAADGVGAGWPALAPFVGLLGTFVAGSATASNILFTDFQQETAIALDLPVLGAVGAQGFGAAVGNMICPHNVVAASATVGLTRREGEILRKTLWVAGVYTGLGGLLALVLVGVG